MNLIRVLLIFIAALIWLVSAYALVRCMIPSWSGSGPIGKTSYSYHWEPHQFVNAAIWGSFLIGSSLFLFRSSRSFI